MYSVYTQICFRTGKWTNEIAEPRVFINSNNSSIDGKKLQPDIEKNKYSSSKN